MILRDYLNIYLRCDSCVLGYYDVLIVDLVDMFDLYDVSLISDIRNLHKHRQLSGYEEGENFL